MPVRRRNTNFFMYVLTQAKVFGLGRLERYFGREQVQLIVEQSKALEQAERAKKRPKRAFEMIR